jgi:flagellar assembly protein FliH
MMSAAKPNWTQCQIQKFEYAAMPYVPAAMAAFEPVETACNGEEVESETGGDRAGVSDDPERIAEEMRRAFASGRERGLLEGRQLEHEAQAALVRTAEEQRTQHAAELVSRFAHERDRYLHQVEQEVVKLALAVAARILRREAQMDPLLLTGAVRVALGQLAGTTEMRLRVPPAELSLWSDAIALLPNIAIRPQVLAGDGMLLGDCVIETELGSVDLGIRSQLGEIERGFFDRAAKRTDTRGSGTVAERTERTE